MPTLGSALPPLYRLTGKYTIDLASNCWNWTASRSSQGRYPTISDGQSTVCAYRVAWESVNGSMPGYASPDGSDRWELHHVCENKQCVNPDHVQLVTRRQHSAIHKTLRSAAKNKWVA